MYEANPAFIQPDNEHVKVWRYMDFTKFVSLLDSHQLYFTRADKFHDRFEGSFPKINVDARQHIPDDLPSELHEVWIKLMTDTGETNQKWPRFHAINCWHMNEHESAAMWKLYLKSDEGIAIQSTYLKLRECFIDTERILLGVVKYIDYDTEWIDNNNILTPFMYKRKSFEHEREVRALVMKWPISENGLNLNHKTIDHGLKIRVDIEKLVEKIYIAPSTSEWFTDLVRAVVKKYGYTFQVFQSKLNEQPVF